MAHRVLIVDGSAVIRRVIRQALEDCPDIEVVGTADNGKTALEMVAQLKPDLVTLDIEMPVMDGLEALDHLRRSDPLLPVVMFSSLSEQDARITLDALERGARDFVAKPSNTGSMGASLEAVRTSLIPIIRGLCATPLAHRPPHTQPRQSHTEPTPPAQAQPTESDPGQATRRTQPGWDSPSAPRSPVVRNDRGSVPPTPPSGRGGSARPVGGGAAAKASSVAESGPARRTTIPRESKNRVQIVAIGSSTGGPDALGKVLAALPSNLRVPVVVTQHMPPVFTRQFSERLDSKVSLSVKEAQDGDILRPGHVYVAPGDFHLTFNRLAPDRVAVVLDRGAKENFCRPAVDVMFRSLAQVFGGGVLATILTGMGTDGANGAGVLVARGSSVYVQDEATSVVWGMPGSTLAAGHAHRVLPLSDIPTALITRIGT